MIKQINIDNHDLEKFRNDEIAQELINNLFASDDNEYILGIDYADENSQDYSIISYFKLKNGVLEFKGSCVLDDIPEWQRQQINTK